MQVSIFQDINQCKIEYADLYHPLYGNISPWSVKSNESSLMPNRTRRIGN